MGPELQDDVSRCLLKDERVEGNAAEEGLHLETLQVTEALGWAFTKKLHQQGGDGTNICLKYDIQ